VDNRAWLNLGGFHPGRFHSSPDLPMARSSLSSGGQEEHPTNDKDAKEEVVHM
jgi:hypothetical protein